MMKKVIFGVICAATLASLIAWRVDWQKNKSMIEMINYEHKWADYLTETEGNTSYNYPTFEYGLNGIDGHFEIEVFTEEGKDTLVCDVHYNWLGNRTYERTYRM